MEQLTAKERNTYNRRKKKVKRICKMYSKDKHTIKECCKRYNVSFPAFWKWTNEVEEFENMYSEAKEMKDAVYNENLITRAQTSLELAITGKQYEEKKTQLENVFEVDSKGNKTGKIIAVEKKVTITEKTVLPNVTAIIFAMKNLKPEKWSDKKQLEHSGKFIPYSGFNFVIGTDENLDDGSEAE